ncbi:MAG: M56 family metallopeptidase [bacterium]
MIEGWETWIGYLIRSSGVLLAAGGIAWCLSSAGRVRGRASIWISALVLFLPLYMPLVSIAPVHPRVEQTRNEWFHSTTGWLKTHTHVANRQEPALRWSLKMQTGMVIETESQDSAFSGVDYASLAAYGRHAVGGIWLAGVLVLAGRNIRGWRAHRKFLASCREVNDPRVLRWLSDCAARAGLKRPPRLRYAKDACVPLVTGRLQPCVVIPSPMLDLRLEKALRFTLLHELAHIRRGDPWWQLGENVAGMLYFFHPLAHWARRQIEREREILCDRFVVEVTRQRASYAEFLLRAVWNARGRPVRVFAIPVGNYGSALTRRIQTILEQPKENTMHTVKNTVIGGVVALLISALLVLSAPSQAQMGGGAGTAVNQETTEPAATEPKEELDHINVEKTGQEGDYTIFHIAPAFESITRVDIARGGPKGPTDKRTLKPEEYLAEPEQHRVKVKTASVDGVVIVSGKQRVPWAWNFGKPLEPGSVKVLIGARLGKPGVDYTVDEAKGTAAFLKKEDCVKDAPYFIMYGFKRDPKSPNFSTGGAIGNHKLDAAARRLLGLPETDAAPDVRTVGTNAAPTADPKVFSLSHLMEESTMRVAVAKRDHPGDLKWLVKDEDYRYDTQTSMIHLLKDIPMDKETEYLFVHGQPNPNVFFAQGLKPGDPVKIIVDGKELVPEKDFKVDYSTGRIEILPPQRITPESKFIIQASGWAFGNWSPNREFQNESGEQPPRPARNSVGTNAVPTDDPKVFNLTHLMNAKTMNVAIAQLKETGNLKWLKKDADYRYDTQTSRIHLLRDIPIDNEKQYLFVQGAPNYDVYFDHNLKPGSKVYITLEGKELIEGKDFKVDYSTGRIEMLKPGLIQSGKKFCIQTENMTFAN